MSDRREDPWLAMRQRRRWLNGFVLAALAYAMADSMAMALLTDGNRAWGAAVEVGAALVVLRAGHVFFKCPPAAILQRIGTPRGRR